MRVFPAASLVLCIFVATGVAQNRFDENSEQLTRILKIRYKNDDQKVKTMLKKLTGDEKAKNDFALRTFTDEQLTQFFNRHVGGYEKWYLPVRNLWNNFKKQAVKWYPHLSVLIDDFVENFLWHKGIFQDKIKKFTATREGMRDLMPFLKQYKEKTELEKKKIAEANMLQLRDILEKGFNLKGSALENFLAQKKTKFSDICMDTKYLFDRASLKTAIAPHLFEICVNSIDAAKEDYLHSDDATQLDEMKKHFANEQCAAREICSQNTLTAMDSLEDKLEPYIAWFRKVSEGNELEGNENIKDEIDKTVFDLIEEILKKIKHSDANNNCLIDNMMRTRSVDKVYASDLLFDEGKLSKKIDPIVKKYKSQYPGVL